MQGLRRGQHLRAQNLQGLLQRMRGKRFVHACQCAAEVQMQGLRRSIDLRACKGRGATVRSVAATGFALTAGSDLAADSAAARRLCRRLFQNACMAGGSLPAWTVCYFRRSACQAAIHIYDWPVGLRTLRHC